MARRPGRAVVLAAGLCMGLLIPCALPAAEGGPGFAQDEQDVGAQLHALDDAIQGLRQGMWNGYAATAALGRDARGRTIGEDIDEWVIPPDALARLQQLRSQAGEESRANHDAQARARLEAAQALLSEQRRRVILIGYYWGVKRGIDRQHELWERWLGQVPGSAAAESRAKVAPLEAALLRALSPTATQEALSTQAQSLLDTLNAERIRLVGLSGNQHAADGTPGLVRERTMPCPEKPAAAPGETAATDRALKVLSRPDLGAFYPDEARWAYLSGHVFVRLYIDAEGCMQRAEIEHSSGAPELDDAALEFAQYMRFLPMIQGGHAAAVQTTMPVNFVLLSNPGEAATITPAATPAGPTAAELTKRGSELLDRRQYDLAIDQFAQAIAKDPNWAMAYADRGMAYVWKRDRDVASQDFDKALSLDPNNWVATHGRGILAFQARHYADAKALFTHALELSAGDSFALWWRAQAYLITGELQNVLADADQMIRLDPAGFRAYPLKALALRLQGKPDESLAVAEQLFSGYPWQSGACTAVAEIYAAAGKHAEALQAMDQSLRIVPSVQSYLLRASYRDQTDVAGSRADIEAALQQDPQSIPAALALAELQTDAGAFKEAEATVQAALAKNSGQLNLLLARGIVYARSQQAELAEKDFASARASAANGSGHNAVCWRLATAGLALADALSECDAALAASPDEAAFLDSRGFVLMRLARYQESIRSYDAAIERRPTDAASLYGRGLAKRGLGDAAGAEADLRSAMTIDAMVRRRFTDYGL